MYLHRRFERDHVEADSRTIQDVAQRHARVESDERRRAAFEPVPLPIKRRSAAARDVVVFEDRHATTGTGEQGRRGQRADAAADQYDVVVYEFSHRVKYTDRTARRTGFPALRSVRQVRKLRSLRNKSAGARKRCD